MTLSLDKKVFLTVISRVLNNVYNVTKILINNGLFWNKQEHRFQNTREKEYF